MSTINSELPTLMDWAKRLDPKGAIDMIVESLSRRNVILQDAVFLEGNLPTGHRYTSRTALPSVYWRRFNEGISPSKSRTDQVTEGIGMLEGFSVIDAEEAKLNGNQAAFRASEDRAFLQALNNEMETGFFYHSNRTAPEKVHGIIPRLDATTGVAGSQVILGDATASGNDQNSMLLVNWSPDTVFGIFPKGDRAGIQPHDMGVQLWEDANGKKFRAFVTNWVWKAGLVVKDYRGIVRIANLDTSAMDATDDVIIPAMIQAYHQIENPDAGRLVWYSNRKVLTYLQLQARNAVKNSTLSIDNIGGKPVTTFMGIPIRRADALDSTEAAVS